MERRKKKMVLAETLISIFIFTLGGGALYLSFKKKQAIAYPALATGFFIIDTFYSATIPFKVNSSTGAVIGTSANIALAGISFLFLLISFIWLIRVIFNILKG